MTATTLFDFNANTTIQSWRVVDDVVMGGRSSGSITLSEEGHGLFSGEVSLENNGGFSSVRHNLKAKDLAPYNKFIVRIKGDGKRYQFRVKSTDVQQHSYVANFETTGDWQEIEISFNSLKPTFRGRDLDMPNFPGEQVEEVAFLIGNKKPQSFKLEIDFIKASK
ncbi:CIA30 family protein [Fulvivirga sp. RKSG066]|nr:CIA30 family protein [Fulvivirga aurantia]